MKKDELEHEVTSLNNMLANSILEDQERRKEFAKTFAWFKPKGHYSGDVELKTPTWPEIWVEIGRLMAARNFMDFEGNLSEVECAIESIKEHLRKQDEKLNS